MGSEGTAGEVFFDPPLMGESLMRLSAQQSRLGMKLLAGNPDSMEEDSE